MKLTLSMNFKNKQPQQITKTKNNIMKTLNIFTTLNLNPKLNDYLHKLRIFNINLHIL